MNHTILVIDESDVKGGQASHLSSRLNGSWKVQCTGRDEALQQALNLKPDCILLDACGPCQRQSQILRELHNHFHTRDIPVVMLFDKHQEQTIRYFMDRGISDFLIKPLNMDELLLRLESIRKRNEHLQELSADNLSNNNVSIVARNTANAVAIVLPEGTIEWVNNGFEKMYGYSLREYMQLHHHDIYSRDSSRLSLVVDHFREGERVFTLEHEIVHRSGCKKWIQATLTPVHDEKGRLQKIVSVESDISELKAEKQRSDDLLLNILPFEIAEQLKKKGSAKSKRYKTVTVMFADFANFTGLTKVMSVHELIHELNEYVRQFDDIIDHHYVEKIKTIGDAYMCAGGLPLKNKSNPFDVTLASLKIRKFVADKAREKKLKGGRIWQLRLGIHSGEVMAGVIGSKRFAYDIWGNTVNIASKMEEMSEIGKINVSGITHRYLKDYFDMTYRGKVQMKNTADVIDMYFVNRLKPEYSQDGEGIYPNQRFRRILAQY